jgi:hypothetical protein
LSRSFMALASHRTKAVSDSKVGRSDLLCAD